MPTNKMNQSSKAFESFQISEQAKEINHRLSVKIDAEIKCRGGNISFAKFMQMALYEPEFGYYQNNLHKFGNKGDFITAPELGKNFAKCLAISICEFFTSRTLSRPKAKSKESRALLEIGAGSGVLALNLLTELSILKALPEQYYILEPSASLQSLQQQLLSKHLPDYFPHIQWLAELPQNICGIIIANEVVDAIPCERIRKVNEQWLQLGVSGESGSFQECEMKPVELGQIPEILLDQANSDNYPEGYTTEYRPQVNAWIKSLAHCLKEGAIILLDYGYADSEFYHPQRKEGSLSCFINHYSHSNSTQFVGLQDITAHVDFTQIAKAAINNALDVMGYTTQAGFLLENGIVEMTEFQSEKETPEQRYLRSQELQKLLMPGQMGEVFKVILLGKNLESEVKGFTLQDHLHRL